VTFVTIFIQLQENICVVLAQKYSSKDQFTKIRERRGKKNRTNGFYQNKNLSYKTKKTFYQKSASLRFYNFVKILRQKMFCRFGLTMTSKNPFYKKSLNLDLFFYFKKVQKGQQKMIFQICQGLYTLRGHRKLILCGQFLGKIAKLLSL
jgi:uncharacterized protein YueI